MLSWDEVDNEDTGAAVIKGANAGHATEAERVADLDFIRLDADAFNRSPSVSIDYAVMEATRLGGVLFNSRHHSPIKPASYNGRHPTSPINLVSWLTDDGDFKTDACVFRRRDCPACADRGGSARQRARSFRVTH